MSLISIPLSADSLRAIRDAAVKQDNPAFYTKDQVLQAKVIRALCDHIEFLTRKP